MLEIHYTLNDEDYILFNQFHQIEYSKIGKRNLFFMRAFGPLLSIIFIGIFVIAGAEPVLIFIESTVLLIFSVVNILRAKTVMKKNVRKVVMKMKEEGGLPYSEKGVIKFTDTEIYECTEKKEMKVNYEEVKAVYEKENAFYIYIDSMQALIIPQRVLSKEIRQQLLEILEKCPKV